MKSRELKRSIKREVLVVYTDEPGPKKSRPSVSPEIIVSKILQ